MGRAPAGDELSRLWRAAKVWPPPPSRPFLNLRCSLMHLLLRCLVAAAFGPFRIAVGAVGSTRGSVAQPALSALATGSTSGLPQSANKTAPGVPLRQRPRSWPRQLGAGDCPFAVGRGDVRRAPPPSGSTRPEGNASRRAPPARAHDGCCHLPATSSPRDVISRRRHLPAPSSPAAPVSRVSPGRRCRLSRCRTAVRWGEGWCSSTRPPLWR
jgi:hypothetical protein